MLFNLRHLLSALEIQNTGSLSEAAKQIHLTQSALTQGINKLEEELGIQLFKRANTGMFCTEQGALFLLRVERAFKHLHDFAAVLFASDKHKKHSFVRSVTSRQLNALIAIAQLQSYTIAAQHLSLTQPTLHRSIKDLETLCDLRLFQRSPTGVEPSWRARQLSRYASLFFAELAQGLQEIGESSGRMDGSIRIGSLPLARTSIVPFAVLTLNAEFPEAHISIIEGPYEEQFNSLQHGQLDLIVGALRPPLQDQDIRQEILFQNQLSIVVKANHALAKRQSFSATELQQLSWVAPAQSTPARHVFSEIFVSRGLAPPSNVIECSSLVATRGILLHSERAALLPAIQVEVEVQAGLLAVCPMVLPDTKRKIGLTMRNTWHPTKMQARFLAIIKHMSKSEV